MHCTPIKDLVNILFQQVAKTYFQKNCTETESKDMTANVGRKSEVANAQTHKDLNGSILS